jgi:hypothetical protein
MASDVPGVLVGLQWFPKSAWHFVTSEGIAGGPLIEEVASLIISIGSVTVSDQKTTLKLRYIGSGASLGPPIPVKRSVSRLRVRPEPKDRGTAGGSTESMNSGGFVFRNGRLGRELMFNDFIGLCGYVEYGVGFVAGKSMTGLVFGVPLAAKLGQRTILPDQLPPILVKPPIADGPEIYLEQANGVILFTGDNISVGASVTGAVGFMIPKVEVTQAGNAPK